MILFNLLLHRPVREKWCVRDIIRDKKLNRKFGTISKGPQFECGPTETVPTALTSNPLSRARAATSRGEGGGLVLVEEQSKAPRQISVRCPVSCNFFCSSKRCLLALVLVLLVVLVVACRGTPWWNKPGPLFPQHSEQHSERQETTRERGWAHP